MTEEKDYTITDDNGQTVTVDMSEETDHTVIQVWEDGEIKASIELSRPESASTLIEALIKRQRPLVKSFIKNADPETDPLLVSLRSSEPVSLGSRFDGICPESTMKRAQANFMGLSTLINQAASGKAEGGRIVRYKTVVSGPYINTDQEGDEHDVSLYDLGLQENASEDEINEALWHYAGEEAVWAYVDGGAAVYFEEIDTNQN